MPAFWRYWLYYLNPSTYWMGGVLAATLDNVNVECAPQEAAYFNPPTGSDCRTYASDFVTQAGGYLMNPDATSDCGYCRFKTGEEYMLTLNIMPKDKWGYFGIFLGFCLSNYFLIYFMIYMVRIRGWTFGFSTLFGLGGKLIDALAAPFKKLLVKKDAEKTG